MHECTNPVWPCAMVGAAACLCGIHDLEVVVHGSSGCFFYPASLLHAPLHGTFLLPGEAVFGGADRLMEVVSPLVSQGKRVAVLTTCVPALTGEDVASALCGLGTHLVEAPGFLGDYEEGYNRAVSSLPIQVDEGVGGVNIDGISRMDPFGQGNLMEAARTLALMGVSQGSLLVSGKWDALSRAAPLTLQTNPDLASGIGETVGSLLGFEGVRQSAARIGEFHPMADISAVNQEVDHAEERLIAAADKYLRRHDPPVTAVFGEASISCHAAGVVHRYLDSEVVTVMVRNTPQDQCSSRLPFRMVRSTDLLMIKEEIDTHGPDLILGSSFEHAAAPDIAFVGITPPLRSRFRLAAHPLVGTEGMLFLMEEVLNKMMDRRAHS
ncbi:MAG: oxidoreductase [Methanomicrobiales archaeon]|nr:oxidoreductase [Methanomicrobiales archaeon]